VGIIGTRGIPNSYGGFERFVEQLVDSPSWPQIQIDFVVYGEMASRRYNAWTRLACIPYEKRQNPLRFYVAAALAASRECDIILCCGVALSYFAFIPRLRGKILFINPDGCEWRRTKWPWWLRLIVRLQYAPALWASHEIIVDADALRADFGLLSSRKCSYIGYPAPDPKITPLRESTTSALDLHKPYILIIARLEPENNVAMALEAYAMLDASDIECLIVAPTTTPHFAQHLSRLQRPGVRFVGGIFDQHVLDELRSNCIAYIHGHSVGGTNPSLLEALSTVSGAVLCHANKYNIEVAGEQACYFSSARELHDLLVHVRQHPTPRDPYRERRFAPAEIADRYRALFEKYRSAGTRTASAAVRLSRDD